ncbi:MAG: hypothetical protein ACLP66_03745 [Polyangia bacterium]
MLLPRRNPAEMDYTPAVATARELSRMAWGSVRQNAYPKLKLGAKCLLLVFGGPGSGKSTYSIRLADSIPGTALLVSGEEGHSPTVSARLLRCNVKRDDFLVIERATVDFVVNATISRKAVSLIIDSIAESVWRPDELRHVLSLAPTLDLLIAIMQVNKAGEAAGRTAYPHEADAIVHVENMQWSLIKSRYQDLNVGGDVLPPGFSHSEDHGAHGEHDEPNT